MGPAHSTNFRGSAAFFAMLLAASSGAPAECASRDAAPADRPQPVSPQAFGNHAPSLPAVSKFTRRRPPLARQSAEGISRA